MDVTFCAIATHKLSRLLAKDPVTSPPRVPFTRYAGASGPAELQEDVRGQGAQKTIGELVTALAGSDLLQFGYAWLERTAQ